MESEFQSVLPEGISLHTARMQLTEVTAEGLEAMTNEIDRCVRLLSTADVDVIAYGCTTGSLIKGDGYDEHIESKVAETAGVPAVATAASVKRALQRLNLDSIAVATPYITELNQREREFLEAAGYSVTAIDGLNVESNVDIGTQPAERSYRQARTVDTADADGIFVSCTNYRTFDTIEHIEQDLTKPVVTSNQATLWDGLRTAGITVSLNLGQLFK